MPLDSTGRQRVTINVMRTLVVAILLISLALAAPIVPFALFGDRLESSVEAWLAQTDSPAVVAGAVFTLLASDVLLPIPSSFVSTYAGAQLGWPIATVVSAAGMSLGAAIGFALARYAGRPLVGRIATQSDLDRMQRVVDRLGTQAVVVTRALPVLAEATLLVVAALGHRWQRVWPALVASNVGIALVYSLFGAWARERGLVVVALVASIALPVLATALARLWIGRVPSAPTTPS